MDLDAQVTAGDLLAIGTTLLLAVLSGVSVLRQRDRPDDEVVMAWQLRSHRFAKDGRRTNVARVLGQNVSNPHIFKLVAVNTGHRDIELDKQFSPLNKSGLCLFSTELVGCEKVRFVRLLANGKHVDGGGDLNRWECEPFQLSIGQALVIEGVASGRPRSAKFEGIRHAHYVRRIGKSARWWWTVGPIAGATGVCWFTLQPWAHDSFSNLTQAAAWLVALVMVVAVWWRVQMTDRRRSWWSDPWASEQVALPAEIERQPSDASLSVAVKQGTYSPQWSLVVENGGRTSAEDVRVEISRNGVALEEHGSTDIDPGCALEIQFTQWPDGTAFVVGMLMWREGGRDMSGPFHARVP
ncbi:MULTISPECIES: hypothetical protein [unclassified Isoptericola]|uniref:hypothetical protein n=1 Tax=unclassified Isoptericola TaxID=2623355 RepID=UPI0036627AE2